MLHNGFVARGLGVQTPVLFFGSTSNPTPTSLFSCVAVVMPYYRDTILELSMMLVRLSGAKSLQDPWSPNSLVSGWPHLPWPRADGWRPQTLATPPLFVLSKWRR